MKNIAIGIILGMGLLSGTAMAGDVAVGKAKSAMCAACHGADGMAMIPGYPHLKGQNEQYLISSITAYKNKERNGGQSAVMQPMAAALSDEDIANLAAYYSSLK
ncbi:cytochrome c [uncultured Vibrio sp.]|uniref:c-type cytochrome n=1 Tax=uncultured Vibrio sp. TaxID=114054 RepID=UPI00090F567A|nr:cytochrome c [uncultured Vibrio sp.]OIQ25489.1 MAG: cytochrome C biogenesis protein CcsB [Vibrio sp. MedPE-SWchi]